jgi:aminoglycoside phosphotransferase (APT) family kinase protein
MARTNSPIDSRRPVVVPDPLSDADLLAAIRQHLPGQGPHAIRGRRTFKRRQDWRGYRLFERVKVDRPGAIPLELCLKYLTAATGSGPATGASQEARAYEFLNGLPRAGAARYFGQVHMPEAGHSILILEYVHGRRLKKVTNADSWSAVASWLGRLHAELAGSGLSHREDLELPRHDEGFFLGWAERAARSAVERCPEARTRLDGLLQDYGRVAGPLASAKPTLVHGELYCTNIMIRNDAHHCRVCPFDWETAAIGCGTLDLAYLGRQELGIEREDLLAAYARGWADVAVRPPSMPTLRIQHAAALVHERAYLLWTAVVHRRVPGTKILKYLDILERLMTDLKAAGGQPGALSG